MVLEKTVFLFGVGNKNCQLRFLMHKNDFLQHENGRLAWTVERNAIIGFKNEKGKRKDESTNCGLR